MKIQEGHEYTNYYNIESCTLSNSTFFLSYVIFLLLSRTSVLLYYYKIEKLFKFYFQILSDFQILGFMC